LSLTQRALAARLSLSPAYVASLEWGERKPSLVVLHRVSQTLHLDAPKLFVLSYPAEARIFGSSRNGGKPEVSAWQRLATNKALRAKERVSPGELKVLKEVSRLGRISSERQLLFVLRSIRLSFEDDWRL
jgi:transcriptional regulator with XRE-family HTH domain